MTDIDLRIEPGPRPRKRRSDGERSRNAILREAAQLATIEGIEGLSIGRLAEAVGMSKSGLFAHFGSKEELQLATIEMASGVFSEQVIDPVADAPNGLDRLRRLTENYLRHVERAVYPGGCFFASLAAEVDTQRGPVHDRAVEFLADWMDRLEQAVRDGQREGVIDPSEEPGQLAFELEALLLLANAMFVIAQEPTPTRRARRALEQRLDAAAVAA